MLHNVFSFFYTLFRFFWNSIRHHQLSILIQSQKTNRQVLRCFIKNNGQRRYKHLVLRKDKPYLVQKKPADSNKIIQSLLTILKASIPLEKKICDKKHFFSFPIENCSFLYEHSNIRSVVCFMTIFTFEIMMQVTS